ncbi:MAG: hypothetical protein BGN88_11095 [Clostridiales bacterium 43-6]|mgnify:CR=1 FL=1|nr:MAG: hypothetical protein BGN88_11095 [Clostridiales bacterium 43-6]
MANSELLCMNCMFERENTGDCPHCGYEENTPNDHPYLPMRKKLQNRYIIGRLISANGEGATYTGYDSEQNSVVRIREFLPEGLFERAQGSAKIRVISGSEFSFNNGLVSFLSLARALARMRDLTAILPVYDIFEENGTAYYISETIESVSLRDYLLRTNGTLSFEQIRPLFMPLLSTLNSLHAVDIIHRGISPETLLIGKDGKLRLTDFCIAEVRTARTDLSPELFKGFAAIEQYGFDGQQGPWTDIYGLAATIYRVLVGNPPPEATARVTNDKMMIPASVAETLPAYVMTALANALQILPEDRTRDIETFREEFSASPTVVNRQQQKNAVKKEPVKGKKSKRNTKGIMFVSLLFTCIAVVLIGAVIYFVISGNKAGKGSTEETTRPTMETTYKTADPGATTEVGTEGAPSLKGFVYSDFLTSPEKQLIELRAKYKFEVVDKKFSDQKRGTILEQTPAAGTPIKRGDTIKLVLSMGTNAVGMPNLVGMDYKDAYITLLEMGFSKDNIIKTDIIDSTMAPNSIVKTDPKASSQVSIDSVITIYVNTYVPTTTPAPTTDPYYYYE